VNVFAKGPTMVKARVDSFRLHSAWIVLIFALLASGNLVRAATYTVTNTNDSVSDTWGDTADTSSLRYAMIQSNASTDATNTIIFQNGLSGAIILAAPLPLILNNLTIDGTGATVAIDGASAYRIFFVGIDAATQTSVIQKQFPGSPLASNLNVTLRQLSLQHGVARGGTGGGGGMGAGGALFVNQAANVTIDGVTFLLNEAIGGNGGSVLAGGGGLGGNGSEFGGGGGIYGNGGYGGGGVFGNGNLGGGGFTGDGGYPGTPGSTGTQLLGWINGSGGSGAFGGFGGGNGGGGGAGATYYGSGGGGFAGFPSISDNGAAGGFGGGGGASGGGSGFGGNAGFGGGGGFGESMGASGGFGGGGAFGARGGFGGGGGDGGSGNGQNNGGFGGGSGSPCETGCTGAADSGGAGYGGAVFVVGGGDLTVIGNVTEGGDSVIGGASVSPNGSGQAGGSGLFLHGSGTLHFAAGPGQVQLINGDILDTSYLGGWSLSQEGVGTLALFGNNSYRGPTSVTDGTLIIFGSNSSGTTNVANSTLLVDGVLSTSGITTDAGFVGVKGVITGSVSVSANSVMTGNGSVASITSSGVLVPGVAFEDPFGTLTASAFNGGGIVLQPGSLTCFHADTMGHASSLKASSNTGNTFAVDGVAEIKFTAAPPAGTTYDLLRVGQVGIPRLVGAFAGYQTNIPGLEGQFTYRADCGTGGPVNFVCATFTVTVDDEIFGNAFEYPSIDACDD
jgi:hypothetical protein